MEKLISYFIQYLSDVYFNARRWIFTIFDLVGIILILFPDVAANVTNPTISRTIGAAILFLSFLIANFKAYYNLAEKISEGAEIRLSVIEHGFVHSHSSRSPYRDLKVGPYGFNKNGLPGYCTLWAIIKAANVGLEKGSLEYSVEEKALKFPQIFDRSTVVHAMEPVINLPARTPQLVDFRLDIRLSTDDPKEFAHNIKNMIRRNEKYKIALKYFTIRVDGTSKVNKLVISGSVEDLCSKVIEHWEGFNHPELVKIAKGAT